MKTEPQLLFKIEDQIAFVTLNRAEKHNALSFEILYGLVETANKIKKDRSIRAVILQGEGPSFCSGLDILGIFKNGMFVNLIKLMGKKPFSRVNLVQKVAMVWREIPVPVISLIHGNCFGGGLQIALGCDFRYASPDAKFSLLEGKWGMIPDMAGYVCLRELLPVDKIKELAMTAQIIDAQTALEYGLVSKVCHFPLEEALRFIDKIKLNSPDSVAYSKKIIQRSWTSSISRLLSRETWYQLRLIATENWKIANNRKLEDPKTYKNRSVS